MENEQRMAGDYEIKQAIHIGDREVVYGEDNNAAPDARFLCGYCQSNELMQQYDLCVVSDDYLEIMALFTQRVQGQIERVRAKRLPNMGVITADMCYPTGRDIDIHGKTVAMKADVLRPEYRSADHQLYYVTGGFGASANSRGNAVFCTNLHSGKQTRFGRYDVLGEVKPEHMPEWAKERLAAMKNEMGQKPKNRDHER